MMFGAGFYTFIKARRYCQGPNDRQLLVTGAAILLLSIAHGMMDVYWRRGVGVFGWVGVGIAVAIMNRPRIAAAASAPAARIQGLGSPVSDDPETFNRPGTVASSQGRLR